MAASRNRITDTTGPAHQIYANRLAHAELNALLEIGEVPQSRLVDHCLFATCEPCPLCFGAFVMSGVQHLVFAARDPVGGSTNLVDKNRYIRRKGLSIEGPVPELEALHIALRTDRALRSMGADHHIALDNWRPICPYGVAVGEELYRSDTLQAARRNGMPASEILGQILERLNGYEPQEQRKGDKNVSRESQRNGP